MIKCYCNKCGKEIWQEMEDYNKDYSIREFEKYMLCTDCILEKFHKQQKEEDNNE